MSVKTVTHQSFRIAVRETLVQGLGWVARSALVDKMRDRFGYVHSKNAIRRACEDMVHADFMLPEKQGGEWGYRLAGKLAAYKEPGDEPIRAPV